MQGAVLGPQAPQTNQFSSSNNKASTPHTTTVQLTRAQQQHPQRPNPHPSHYQQTVSIRQQRATVAPKRSLKACSTTGAGGVTPSHTSRQISVQGGGGSILYRGTAACLQMQMHVRSHFTQLADRTQQGRDHHAGATWPSKSLHSTAQHSSLRRQRQQRTNKQPQPRQRACSSQPTLTKCHSALRPDDDPRASLQLSFYVGHSTDPAMHSYSYLHRPKRSLPRS